jgi:hypothetical protein
MPGESVIWEQSNVLELSSITSRSILHVLLNDGIGISGNRVWLELARAMELSSCDGSTSLADGASLING